MQEHGIEKTLAAIRGYAFEPRTKSFDPAEYASIIRLSKREVFERAVNLGMKMSFSQERRERIFNPRPDPEPQKMNPEDQRICFEAIHARIAGRISSDQLQTVFPSMDQYWFCNNSNSLRLKSECRSCTGDHSG